MVTVRQSWNFPNGQDGPRKLHGLLKKRRYLFHFFRRKSRGPNSMRFPIFRCLRGLQIRQKEEHAENRKCLKYIAFHSYVLAMKHSRLKSPDYGFYLLGVFVLGKSFIDDVLVFVYSVILLNILHAFFFMFKKNIIKVAEAAAEGNRSECCGGSGACSAASAAASKKARRRG